MAEEDAPEESGTSEEQDENSIPVEAAEGETLMAEAPPQEKEDGEQEADDIDMAEEMAEAQELLADFDPENVAACALVVSTKEGHENPDGEETDGLQWRVLNPDLEGYEDTRDVVNTLANFNDALENCDVAMERPAGPLGALFGGH